MLGKAIEVIRLWKVLMNGEAMGMMGGGWSVIIAHGGLGYRYNLLGGGGGAIEIVYEKLGYGTIAYNELGHRNGGLGVRL